MRINETCSCGASFEIEGDPQGGHYWATHDTRATYPPIAEVVAAWRESHYHEPAPAVPSFNAEYDAYRDR